MGGVMGAILMFDWIIVLLMVFSIVGVGILGWRNASPPIFFILLLFFSMFLGAVSFLLDYIFYQIITNSAFSSIINYYPNTILICTNLHWLALAMLVVGGYASYTSQRQQP